VKLTKLTFGALIAAAAVAVLALGAVVPTLDMAAAGFAGFLLTLVVIRSGHMTAWMSFAVTAVLAWLLLPGNRNSALFFVIFFGWYPIVKSYFERFRHRLFEWIGKAAVANAAFAALYFGFTALITDKLYGGWMAGLVFAVFNIIFVLYDLGLTRWIAQAGRLLTKLK